MGQNDAKTKDSKRKHVRYDVSDDCRLRASITIRSSDSATASKDWPGTLVDMSAGGAHIRISLGAVAYIGDSCTLHLSHQGVKTELRGVLAHYVCSARHSVCGVKFDDFSTGWDKSYQPFFKAIIASTTLKGGPAGSDAPGRYREEYSGPGHAKLVVWRDGSPERALLGFEYTMVRYTAVLETVGADMFKNKEKVSFKAAEGGMALSRAQEADARWEFSIAASNLPKALEADIRRLLRLVS
ncbi:MAG: PilZ domain-containing protein [Lacunisphaera sp.]|nr:PilZ domain-containing protein [Lacunisphaera sp.]